MKNNIKIIFNWDKNNENVTISKKDWEKVIGLIAENNEVNHLNWSDKEKK